MRTKMILYPALLVGTLFLLVAESLAQPLVSVPADQSESVSQKRSALEIALNCAEQTGAPIFVIAGRKTCSPCQALKRQVKTDEPTRQLLRDCVKVYIDCDSAEYQQWIAVHPPTDAVLPQWFLVRADGQELVNRAGGVSGQELKTVLGSGLSRAGGIINEPDSLQVEMLVAQVSQLLDSQDDLAAAETIMKATPILRIASNNYSAPSNQLRQLIRQVQSKLVHLIDSATKELSELDQLNEPVQAKRLSELRTLIGRLRSIPSVATQLRNLESKVAELQSLAEMNVQRFP